jgi:isopentenyl diphosphate isomerase/L-lactate dehydrogenase-like FMN-dependent dehydrogenase
MESPNPLPVYSLAEYQNHAEEKISADAYGYYVSGSDDEITLRNNISAFKKIYLNPRVLVDMTDFSMKARILGEEVDLPFGIAPFALQKILHPKG